MLYELSENYKKNIIDFKRVLTLMSEEFDKDEELAKSEIILNIGIGLHKLSYTDAALTAIKIAINLYSNKSDFKSIKKCYMTMGIIRYSCGEYIRAIEYLGKAISTSVIGDECSPDSSKCYGVLGLAYFSLCNYKKAIICYEKVLKIDNYNKDWKGETECYTNIGSAYYTSGSFRKSIEYLENALNICLEHKYIQGIMLCYSDLAISYDSLGDYTSAIRFLNEGLQYALAGEYKKQQISYYINLSISYKNMRSYSDAFLNLNKAFEIATSIKDSKSIAMCISVSGNIYLELGNYYEAVKCHTLSLESYLDLRDKRAIRSSYLNIGVCNVLLNKFEEATAYLKKVLDLKSEVDDNIDTEMKVYFWLAKVNNDSPQGNPNLAYEYCKKSIELSEIVNSTIIEDNMKISFSSRVIDYYSLMILICNKSNKNYEAFEYLERSKSRAFLKLIATTEFKPYVAIDSELESLLKDEELCLMRKTEIQTRNLRQNKISMEVGELEHLEKELKNIYDNISNIDPEYALIRSGKALSLDKIIEEISIINRSMALIEYFILEDRLLIFVITSKAKNLICKTIFVTKHKLNSLIHEDFNRSIIRYPEFGDIGNSWLELSNYLINPILEYISEGELLCFIPNSSIFSIPIHALELNGTPLIVSNPVVYCSSSSMIKFIKDKGSGKYESITTISVDVLGNLTGLMDNAVRNLTGIFTKDHIYRDNHAIKNVMKECKNVDILHFLGHGILDKKDPLCSGLLFFDGKLTSKEIYGMKFNAELIILSACYSGVNEVKSGDELIGLTRAFLYAGASAVLVSLWEINGKATIEFLGEFLNALKEKNNKADALQLAQIRLMEKYPYEHPYYWAPFILFGF